MLLLNDYNNFNLFYFLLFLERWFLCWCLLFRSSSEHYSVCVVYIGDTITRWLFSNCCAALVGMGALCQYGTLCISKYANTRVWCWRSNNVRIYLFYIFLIYSFNFYFSSHSIILFFIFIS